MSTLEKAMGLLQEMPERKPEAVYMYMRFVNSQADNDTLSEKEKKQRGFQNLMSFVGTLPQDFDYEQELEEIRN